MSTNTSVVPAAAEARPAAAESTATPDRHRRRAIVVTIVATVASLMLLVDLLLVGHTQGEQIWGPITAGLGAGVGTLSLAFLAMRGRRRAARLALYALWLTVAFFGFGGYQSHRLVGAGGEGSGPPPLAPLVFTGLGIAGALSLRYGNKED